MDGSFILLILIPVVFLILLVAILSRSAANHESLQSIKRFLSQVRDQLHDLDNEIRELRNENQQLRDMAPKPSAEAAETKATMAVKKDEVPPSAETPEPISISDELEKIILPTQRAAESLSAREEIHEKERQTDWEKFIGENLANKIGIAVLVLGISFFVKFAIDKNWVNETGRVIIGLISGGILIGLAHYIRNAYRSFSSVLVGGGLTVFYFTVAFAFHQYHLIGQTAAFIIMIVITAFAVILSIFYNRIELAVLATIGGFVTPFLVSNGQNNYVALFTYLCILNSGLLVLSWFKRWKPINIIALLFTILIYGGWLIRQLYFMPEPFPARAAMLFASLFYILSMAINIINNLKLNIRFGGFDFILLLTINFLYYVAGMVILNYWDSGEHQGVFTAALGIVNLLLTLVFFKQKRVDKNFVRLLIGMSVLYISLSGPVQLQGNHITLFWAAESVVLFWLYQRSRISLLKIASLLLLCPLTISLLMDWSQAYSLDAGIVPLFINKGFVTTFATTVAFFLYYKLTLQEKEENYLSPALSNRGVRNLLHVSFVSLAYATGAWEVYYQFLTRIPDTLIYSIYLQLYTFSFIVIMLQLVKKSPHFSLIKFLGTLAGFTLYLINLRNNYEISWRMLITGGHSIHMLAHWVGSALLIWLFYDLVIYFRKEHTATNEYVIPFTWAAAGCLIFLLSIEMYHVIMWTSYGQAEDQDYWENLYYKAGLSILWGLCSFAMMWIGMKNQFRTLRIISLSLFTITIIKLFIFDIQNIPPGGKIAAFILLGVLLLIVSFMYQRLKKIIIGAQDRPNHHIES